MKRIVVGALVLIAVQICGLSALAQDGPIVFNVRATQRAGTNLVDVYYGVTNDEQTPVTITLHLSTDGGGTYPHLCGSVSGDEGSGVETGVNRHIEWDAGADFPGYSSDTCKLRVTADGGSQGGDFQYVSGGTFLMGRDYDVEHWVHVGNFYMGITEVTQAQYAALVPEYEVRFGNRPADYISWYDAVRFCNLLSEEEGFQPVYNTADWTWDDNADGYRLPTESEWEYACRANSTTEYCNGNGTESLDSVGWYSGNSGGRTHDVHTKNSNNYDIYDMHGNIWEWCWDRYGTYPEGPPDNPHEDDGGASATGTNRVMRGGHFNYNATHCRSAYRNNNPPSYASSLYGFRLVRSAN